MPNQKQSLSSFDIAALVLEYQEILGSHIKKAYQPKREVVVLRLNTKEGRRELVIRTGKAFYLTNQVPENPPLPTGFAMMLRKYLTNGRITAIEQQEFDRIIRITIQKEETFELIIEGFGDGNVILVKDGKIIQPLISRSWRHRVIRAGREYEVPPSPGNPRTMDFPTFSGIMQSSDRDVVRTLAMGVNLGGELAEEVCARAGVEKKRESGSISLEELDLLFGKIGMVFGSLGGSEDLCGILVMKDGAPFSVAPVKLGIYSPGSIDWGSNHEEGKSNDEGGGEDKGNDKNDDGGGSKEGVNEYTLQEFENFNLCVEKYFAPLVLGEDHKSLQGGGNGQEMSEIESGDGLRTGNGREGGEGVTDEFSGIGDGTGDIMEDSQEVQRIKRTIDQQRETIVKLQESIGVDQERAERLFHKYQEFEKVITDIKVYGEKNGWDEMAKIIRKNPKVLEVDLAKKFVVFSDEPTTIRLDFLNSINENAQRYYGAATRAREKLEGATRALADSEMRLLSAHKKAKKEIERKKVDRKHFWFEKNRWFISSEGNIIIGGKDARSNDRVVKKYLKDRDRYAHAEIHGAPSLVIKSSGGKEIGERTLEEACIYAACFSRAWRSGIGGVEAYWVLPDQVSKTPAAGEFIAKGSFIIRGRRNRYNATLTLGIGKIEHEGVELVMCGPISAIEKWAEEYVVIEPGDTPKNEFARKLSRHYGVPNEDALSIIPGDVRIKQNFGVIWDRE